MLSNAQCNELEMPKPGKIRGEFNAPKMKSLRKRKRLSGGKASRMIDANSSYVSRIESGRILFPTLQYLQRLLNIYDADIFDVLDVLNLKKFDYKAVQLFRHVCKEDGTNPDAVIGRFIQHYSMKSLVEKQTR